MDFAGIKALTFDCYGTLIDWEAGILAVLRPWARQRGINPYDEELMESFALAEARREQTMPMTLYSDILRIVMGDIADGFGVLLDPGDADLLAESIGDWPPFPDTQDALNHLRKKFKLVIISNVDRASFKRTGEKLGVEFDLVVTAEGVGAYKPDHKPFQRAFNLLEEVGVSREEIVHVAQSLFHDHMPAKELGLKTVWVDRRLGKAGWGATLPPPAHVKPDLIVASLAELAEMV